MKIPCCRNPLVVIGCFCLVLAFVPWSRTVRPSPATERHFFTIGIPTGPWFIHVNERAENPDKTTTFSNGREFRILSQSTFLFAGGIVLQVIGRRRGSGSETSPTETPPT